MELGLKGRVAIVTGASKGIGFAASKALAQEGADLVICSRDESNLKKASEEISTATKSRVFTLAGDVTAPDLADELAKMAMDQFNRIDIVINNSGGPPPKSLTETDMKDWEYALNLNFLSSVRLTKAVLPIMKEASWGRIITIGSTLMKEPDPGMILSASARAAMTAFMKSLSFEVAKEGITINTIATGGVETERLQSLIKNAAESTGEPFEKVLAESAESIPIGRFAKPDEFVKAIVFLASEAGSYITGECLAIDGGLMKSAF